MRLIKGALHAHAVMRYQGRTPGDEGRAVIEANCKARKRDQQEGRQWRVGYTLASQFPF
jgi:hypothetical protein